MDPTQQAFHFIKTSFEMTVNLLSKADGDEKTASKVPLRVKNAADEKASSSAKKQLFTYLGDLHKSSLIDILSHSDKPKIMILDPYLIGPLGRMLPATGLKHRGVKVFHSLNNASLTYKNHHYIYLVHSSVKKINQLNELFTKNLVAQHDDNLHCVYTLPRTSILLDEKLQEKGLAAKISHIEKYVLNIFPLAHDLLSIELKGSLKTMVHDSDPTPLLNIADAIYELEKVYGKIENINVAGKYSEKALALLKRRRNEQETKVVRPEPFFSRLTIIDRAEDLITPYLIPSTYEALIDEFIGITDNHITLEDKSTVSLEYDNDLYLELKDAHISTVKKIINEEIEKIKQVEARTKSLLQNPQATVTDCRQATDMAKEIAARKIRCKNHIHIAQFIMDKLKDKDLQLFIQEEQNILTETNPQGTLALIDDMLNRGGDFADMLKNERDLNQVIRMLFLYAQVYGNPKKETYEDIATGVVQTFGYKHLHTLRSQEELTKLRKAPYAKLQDTYHLIHEFDPAFPQDIAYTHYGYAPLSCRIIEQLLSKPLEKPGTGLELVCFVGGCTRAEVSACRLISSKIVVLTTEIITGKSVVDAIKIKKDK